MQETKLIQNHRPSPSTDFVANRVRIGLKKLSSLLDKLRYDAEVSYVTAPDFSMTLNEERFKGGFSIGGILKWGPGDIPLIPLQLMPNCCGAILARIRQVDPDHIIQVIDSIKNDNHQVNGIRIQWDVSRKNHFFNIYSSQAGDLYAILHCSLPETKADNILGAGTYFTASRSLSAQMETFECREGQLVYLQGKNALDFYSQIQLYSEISKRKRQYIMSLLFPESTTISNENHLDFVDMNTMLLGCYSPDTKDISLPLTVGPWEKAYILQPNLPFEYNVNQAYYIIPHGTGSQIIEFDKLEYMESDGLFMLRKGQGVSYTTEISQLTRGYNDIEQIQRREFDNLFLIKEILNPLYQFRL